MLCASLSVTIAEQLKKCINMYLGLFKNCVLDQGNRFFSIALLAFVLSPDKGLMQGRSRGPFEVFTSR